jgi:hypothetical protein
MADGARFGLRAMIEIHNAPWALARNAICSLPMAYAVDCPAT